MNEKLMSATREYKAELDRLTGGPLDVIYGIKDTTVKFLIGKILAMLTTTESKVWIKNVVMTEIDNRDFGPQVAQYKPVFMPLLDNLLDAILNLPIDNTWVKENVNVQ